MGRSILVARIAAAVAGLLAVVAFLTVAAALPDVPRERVVIEAWRVIGLATWAALFGLLAVRPSLIALWAVAVASKLALVVTGVVLGDAPDAGALVLWDGLLAVVLGAGLVAAVTGRARSAPSGGQTANEADYGPGSP